MPRFNVYGVVTGTKFLGVFEAESEEEAKAMAMESDQASVSLCHQCSNECEDPEIHECVTSPADDATEE